MTKDDIIVLPNAALRRRSRKVGVVSAEIKQVIADMEAATLDWEASREHEVGVALAAIQIDRALRIVVVRNNYNDKTDHNFTAFINPEITKYEGSLVEDYEGCLSIKNIYGKVPRYEKVRVKALGLDGKPFRVTADGFLARVLQHEIDHTNGIVFIDHIKDDSEAFYRLQDDGELTQLAYASEIAGNRALWSASE